MKRTVAIRCTANGCGKLVGHIVSEDGRLSIHPEPWSEQLVQSRFFAAMKHDFFNNDTIASWPESPTERWDAREARQLSMRVGRQYASPIALDGVSVVLPCRCVKKDATWLGTGFLVVSPEHGQQAIESAKTLKLQPPRGEYSVTEIIASDDVAPDRDDPGRILWQLAQALRDAC